MCVLVYLCVCVCVSCADIEQQAPQHAPAQVVDHDIEPGSEPGTLGEPPRQPAVHPYTGTASHS